MSSVKLAAHQHGKSRVRLGRTWRRGDVHEFVEFDVYTMLESDMEHAFLRGDNTDMTATDTQKNTVRPVPASNKLASCADDVAHPSPLIMAFSTLDPGVLHRQAV